MLQAELFGVKRNRWVEPEIPILELSPRGASRRLATDLPQRRAQEGASGPPEGASTAEQRGDLRPPSTGLVFVPQGDTSPTLLEQRRAEWLEQVDVLTTKNALARARDILIKGLAPASREGVAGMRFAGPAIPDTTLRAPDQTEQVEIDGIPVEVSKWHAARARGTIHKWKRIQACRDSTDGLRSECGCNVTDYRIGCGHRECPKCRTIRARKLRRDVKRARISLRTAAKQRKKSKVFREKFLTLTIPHFGGLFAARRRIQIIYKAWANFAPWFRRYLKTIAGKNVDLCHFWRMFEWTEGKDELGHPHFHVWVHSPWLNQDLIHAAWRTAIEEAAGERVEVLALPDLRAVRNGVEDELVKYMLKDMSDSKHCEFVSPPVVAMVLDELIGRRRRQTSRGLSVWIALFLKDEHPPTCECCGLRFEYRFTQMAPPVARPPPD
jgi:hypothetical protein